MRRGDKIREERIARPLYAAITSGAFALVICSISILLIIFSVRGQVEDDTNLAGAFIAAHLSPEKVGDAGSVSQGTMLEMRAATILLPSGGENDCVVGLTLWFIATLADGKPADVAALVTPICAGQVVSVGHGRAGGAIDILLRRQMADGSVEVSGAVVRRGPLNIAHLLSMNPWLIGIVVFVTVTAAAFAYALRLRPYRLFVAATRRATTDGLSGVLRREEFLDGLNRSLDIVQAQGGMASLLAIDLDHFKSINDRFGHGAGDEVIRVCGTLISNAVRGGDIVGRVGGEEFMVLLPSLPKYIAVEVADRLRKRMMGHAFHFAGDDVFVTISIGVASVMPADTPAALAERADRRLYHAKRSGRNRVVSEDDDNYDY